MKTGTIRHNRLALAAALVLLAGISMACSLNVDEGAVSLSLGSSNRWVSGYVYDFWSGQPVSRARVLVENNWNDEICVGYTDSAGCFDVYVGAWYDGEEILFRVWEISAEGYLLYVADRNWYAVGDIEILYTGEYLLDRSL